MVRIFLRSRIKADGTYPIVLSVTKKHKTKVFSLGISCKKSHWNGKKLLSKHPNNQIDNLLIQEKENEANAIISEFELKGIDFTLKQFEKRFKKTSDNRITIADFWNEKIQQLNQAGRTGNAQVLISTYNSFFKFTNDKSITFQDVTYDLLHQYEVFLRSKGNTDGGIGVKMRAIRSLYNQALNADLVEEKYYPFNKFQVSRFKSRSTKKALTRDEIGLIEKLDVEEHPDLINAKNYFLFSYYTQGMNFFDQMKLEWKNISRDRLYYTRSKTKRKFSIKILPPVREILDYYKIQNRKTPYVFPILLKTNLTPIQIENRKKKTLRIYNRKLKKIGEILEIDKKITSYTARHSFATNLKYVGISTDVVSQSLGHKDLNVTQSYLKDFEDKVIDDAIEKLLKEVNVEYLIKNEK
ncbi:phage integrase SAM-like domain-containing protein [Zunongwangia sp. H14]|uniref:phage integrase SAM-like domain-containing protein n=1 Tax=Zunongwangia sp. H14 TaxID=3240792 RepID=UPI0035653D10